MCVDRESSDCGNHLVSLFWGARTVCVSKFIFEKTTQMVCLFSLLALRRVLRAPACGYWPNWVVCVIHHVRYAS